MTTLREAAERAMKSLEDAIKVWTEEMEFRSCIDASDEWLESYAALREALSEPEQAPVAWMLVNAYGEADDVTYEDPMGDLPEGWTCKPLYTPPPKRKPLTDESIGEVAIQDTQYHGYAMAIKPHIQVALEEGTKLYTTPPKRQPLTDGQIGRLCRKFDARHSVAIGIAREIERAHGIGEKA